MRINIYIFRILQQSIGFFYIENGQVQYDLELERERIRQEEKERAELERRQWEEEEQKRFNEKEARLKEEEVQLTINIVVRLYNQNSCANVTVFEGPFEQSNLLFTTCSLTFLIFENNEFHNYVFNDRLID